ncbi:hypothetical protein [Staphylococcus epidermidis]|uniref:hypothetical protein n=3 Tax=Staphylococcus epidermidis TaxID=1282 RepID=UPI0007370076|nr:hypothetical protein [Staphylococcus epidermidis]KTT58899.1 hypothetical protein SB7C_11430 [Staphylococcus epidermidis]KTT81646.1 hypothetical protein SA6_03205 [Staphylococcus epidermidis]MCG2148484.1 hypothetical protein [Staphylococcus epidermidis]MCG2263646.1 hypothetical protein [Staphylococcus epidermidis]MCK6181825.1 hypothetical protein [Staphylococcus epidermidis]
MKIIGKYKDYFGFEKRLNENLMPTKIKFNDIMNLILLTICVFFGVFTYVVQLTYLKDKFNFFDLYNYSIIAIFDLMLSIASVLLVLELMKRKNAIFLFIKRKDGFHKLDKYYFDITDKQTIQYKKENSDITLQVDGNKEEIISEHFYTEVLDHTNKIEMIKTKNKEEYHLYSIFVLYIAKAVSSIVIALLLNLNKIFNIVNDHLSLKIIYIGIIPCITIGIFLFIGFKLSKYNEDKMEKELFTKLNRPNQHVLKNNEEKIESILKKYIDEENYKIEINEYKNKVNVKIWNEEERISIEVRSEGD